MNKQRIYIACVLVGAAFCFSHAARAQTDIAGSVYGAFAGSATSGIDIQTPSNSAGGLLELRHIDSSLIGFEAAYSYNRANQVYFYTSPPPVPCASQGNCYVPPIAISANAHSLTGDWVVSRKMRHIQPFALAGGGILLVIPSGGQQDTSNATEFTFLFGAGLDWKFSSHFGLRLQYRDSFYKAPPLTGTGRYPLQGGSGLRNTYTYTQEPALGVYYRF
jgi:opacity protein-like surface antigen